MTRRSAFQNRLSSDVLAPASPVRWRTNSCQAEPAWPVPPLLTAMRRGALGRCPSCGQARAFAGWLRVAQICPVCETRLGEIRADDAPPYFTIFIVAHIAIGAQLLLERVATLSVATELAIFLPATLALTLVLIRPVKGATLGLMLRLGFASNSHDAA